jgi:hypothetical protein
MPAMDKVPKTEQEAEDSYRHLMSVLVGIYAKRGVDLPAEVLQLANDYLAGLRAKGGGLAIEKLLRAGCKRIPLAAILNAVRLVAKFPEVQNQVMGSQRIIEKMGRDFARAAELFEGVAKAAQIEASDESLTGYPTPARMAEYLRAYASAIDPAPAMKAATNAKSIRDVERYALTSYVKSATGDWHDIDVSEILAVATEEPLEEDAHRTWRNRKFASITLPIELISRLAELIEEEHDKSHPK